MPPDPKIQCVAVRSPRGATTTEIEWKDGHRGIYPHVVLRGYCPCAACQGHSGDITFIRATGKQLEIEELTPVGNYALQIEWFDGHGSGLYSFKYLRALCCCKECRPEGVGEEHPTLPRL